MLRSLLVIAFIAVGAQPSLAGDATKGEKIFKRCISCHMVGEGAKPRVGPALNNIFSRGIGAVEGYSYSKSMKEFAASEGKWTEENLSAYLESPRSVVKGTIMSFGGLRKDTDRADVIAYLKQFDN